MIFEGMTTCPICGGELKFYDCVNRLVRTNFHRSRYVSISRYKCVSCKTYHRLIPSYILPYKQYEKEVVNGVQDGLITEETLGFEDYPCTDTMNLWRNENERKKTSDHDQQV